MLHSDYIKIRLAIKALLLWWQIANGQPVKCRDNRDVGFVKEILV